MMELSADLRARVHLASPSLERVGALPPMPTYLARRWAWSIGTERMALSL